MMKLYEEMAWDVLDELEKSVLILCLTHGKSVREVGSIIKKPHYTCLKVKTRAENLFKIMMAHYYNYEALFSPKSPTSNDFRTYMESLIEDRKTVKESYQKAENYSLTFLKLRDSYVIKYMEYLKLSDDPWDKSTYEVIMEFDRYNNFRILPKAIQRPSPFKRNYTKEMVKYIDTMTNLKPVTIDYLLSLVGKSEKEDTQIYTVIFSYEEFEHGYKVLPIYYKNKNIEIFEREKFYLWSDIEEADYFGAIVSTYAYKEKIPGSAQKFWNKYREQIKLAINYKDVNNIRDEGYNIEKILRDKRLKEGVFRNTHQKKIEMIQKNYFH